MTNEEPTRAAPDPSDSLLLTLARAAMAPDNTPGDATWPHLDLDDPAQRQFGDYELLEEIDRGGMGVVYRAHQHSLDREVAIKFIAAGIADAFNVGRFLAEARAAARLLHPNIVPVYEVGSLDGVHYFSMPLIKGRTLGNVLQTGTLDVAAAIKLSLTLCDALDYAHRLGLLHLDLKPTNILLDERNEPLIADFGLARHVDEQGGVDAQEVSGTPSFMAPEQILIKQYRLTRATDIYALGAILYRGLSGISPHGDGKPDDVIRRAAAGRVRPPRSVNPKIPRDLDAICMKCLELQPADRYASTAQLADDLRRARDCLPVSVRRIGWFERAQRWLRREPKLAAAVVCTLCALVVGATATTWQWKQAAGERDRARIAGEIGAHLFAYKGKEDQRARDLVQWLRKRLPGNEARQAGALADFAGSVRTNTGESQNLLIEIVRVLGADYRRRMIAALQAGHDPKRNVYSALIAYADENASDAPTRFATYLKAAIAARPKDPFVWQMAAVFCPGKHKPHCLYPQAAETLAELDPDNMYPYLLQVVQSRDDVEARARLHQAALRSGFNDYSLELFRIYPELVATAHVPVPPLIARPLQWLAPKGHLSSNIANIMMGDFPLAPYERLANLCGNRGEVTDPQVRADCLKVGERMFRSSTHATVLAQMIGVALVRNVDNRTPLAKAAHQKRRQYSFIKAMMGKASKRQILEYPIDRFLHDIGSVGELDAWRRFFTYYGMPDHPAPNWKPDDPTDLLTSRERTDQMDQVIRDARALLTRGAFGDAAALLAPLHDNARTHFGDTWRWVRFQTALARARIGQQQFAAAQTALDEAWNVAGNFEPASPMARACVQAYADLYAAWNAAEPGHGHAARHAHWQQELATRDASEAE